MTRRLGLGVRHGVGPPDGQITINGAARSVPPTRGLLDLGAEGAGPLERFDVEDHAATERAEPDAGVEQERVPVEVGTECKHQAKTAMIARRMTHQVHARRTAAASLAHVAARHGWPRLFGSILASGIGNSSIPSVLASPVPDPAGGGWATFHQSVAQPPSAGSELTSRAVAARGAVADREDRARGFPDDPLGDRPEQDMAQPGSAVGRDHDQVDLPVAGVFHDPIDRIAPADRRFVALGMPPRRSTTDGQRDPRLLLGFLVILGGSTGVSKGRDRWGRSPRGRAASAAPS